MTKLDSTDQVAVDDSVHWRKMSTCRVGAKVQLCNAGGVATYGTYNGKDKHWLGWAPLPTFHKSPPPDSDYAERK